MKREETYRQYRARRRLSLFEKQGGLCHWCRGLMVLPPDGHHKPGRLASNAATIEHLRDRFHPDRAAPNPEHERRWVLACLGCNNRRGAANEAAAGVGELRRRSRYYDRFNSKGDDRHADA